MFSLQKLLGHTSLEMVRRYVNLLDGEVREQHHKFSPVESLFRETRPKKPKRERPKETKRGR